VSEQEKDKVKIEDLPVPLKDLNPDEQEEVKGGTNVNPSRPPGINPVPTINPRPSEDAY